MYGQLAAAGSHTSLVTLITTPRFSGHWTTWNQPFAQCKSVQHKQARESWLLGPSTTDTRAVGLSHNV